MVKNACNMLENFDKLVDGGLLTEEDFEDLLEECIGEESSEGHRWIPLCPDFPNLKGVTCNEIEEFIDKHSPDIAHDEKWQRKIDEFVRRFDVVFTKMRSDADDYKSGKEFEKDPEIEFWYNKDGEGAKITREIIDFLMETLPDKEKATFEMDVHKEPTVMLSWAKGLNKYYDPDRGWQRVESRALVRDYLHNVKVYDRDEEHKAFQQLGEDLAKRIWNKMSGPERDRVYSGLKLSDKSWDELTEMGNIRVGEKDQDMIKSLILRQRGTIYVTTPRGGHEMLSIFSYANQIPKDHLPSRIVYDTEKMSGIDRTIGMVQQQLLEMETGDKDEDLRRDYDQITSNDIQDLKAIGYDIENFEDYKAYHIDSTKKSLERMIERRETEPKERHRGKTWLGDSGGPVERVVVIDDIVASGLQIDQAYREIKKEFPKADVLSVHLCHRKNPDSKDNPLVEFGKAVYDTDTSGIVEWKDRRKFKPIAKKFLEFDEGIDGYYKLNDDEKEALAQELYGGNRYINKARLEDMAKFLREVQEPMAITCAYPHSLPDGRSDRILVDLYGGRVHAEKRGRLEK